MRGFTLIELVVAMAIVAILTAAALPTYQDLRHRSHRSDARLSLLWVQYQQERHYATHNVYADALSDLATGIAGRSAAGDYDLAVTLTNGGQGYVATALAHASGSQARDNDCRWLSVNELGQRRSATDSGIW